MTDQNDSVIAGAAVSVTNQATGLQTSVTTNEYGYYTVPGLPPDPYHVEVTQKGFKKTVRDLELQVAQIAVADFKLEVGAVTESVTVEAGTPVTCSFGGRNCSRKLPDRGCSTAN